MTSHIHAYIIEQQDGTRSIGLRTRWCEQEVTLTEAQEIMLELGREFARAHDPEYVVPPSAPRTPGGTPDTSRVVRRVRPSLASLLDNL